MQTIMMLCDYAESIGGKLYIMGGGWTVCPSGPRNMAVALRILVPWDEANTRHEMALILQDSNGTTVTIGEPGQSVRHEGHFEVGRPPGLPPGTELEFTSVMGFVGLPLEPDKGYRWQFEIDGEPAAHASFRTLS